MSAIRFEGVSLRLGGRTVLSDVSLDVDAGEFVAVLGPNGSGKTTLMRAVLGLVPPRRGSIEVLGAPASRGNPAIGYMPQTRAMPLATPMRGRAEIDRTLRLVGAQELARRPLAELSGGERQRLLLAQALIGEPRLLLLDEPLISLDPRHEEEVVALVRSLQRRLGVTVLFSAHELNPLLGAIDRVLYLGRGAAALGTVEEVVTGPVLSRLYGSEIEVVRLDGRIFVMSGGHFIERGEHRHDSHDRDGRHARI